MGKQTALALCLLAVAGCAAPVPDDTTSGVGFGDYDSYQAGRAAQPGATPAQTALSPGAPGGTDLAALAAAAIDEAEAGQTGQPGAGAPVATGTGPAPTGERRISDEQDFEAVSARESIESDAERRQRMQDQRVVIAPTAVPDRPGETGPNIVEYALSTGHPVGAQIYRRFPRSESRHQRNCLAYRSADLAQEAFLEHGGPDRDRYTLDPDGDGYACAWDPVPFRRAALAARTE